MTPSLRRSVRAAAAVVLLATSGCSQIFGACTSDLQWRVTPETRTLRVGERFTPELALFGCGGTERLTDTITWSTADAAVATVETATGRVTALVPGETTVTGHAADYGVSAGVRVTVVAP